MYAAVSSLLTETAVDIIGHTQKPSHTHKHTHKWKRKKKKARGRSKVEESWRRMRRGDTGEEDNQQK